MKLLLLALLPFSFGAEDFTVFEFSRLINTCDAAGDVPIGPAGTSRVVWAYNDNDPTSEDEIQYHQARGSRSVNLLGQVAEPVPLEPDATPIDLLVDNVSVESGEEPGVSVDTLYYCKVFPLPQDKKRHVVRVEPLIESMNLEYVHHILVYQCPYELPDHLHRFERDCYLEDNPPEIYDCIGNSALVAWAVGGGIWNTPANAGYPMGEGFGGHVVMEIHYDNPFLRPVVDSSGFRLWATETLREHDAGIMAIGKSTESIYIPPKMEAFDEEGECHKECSEKIWPNGANAFGVFLHAHLLGRAINLQHIRNKEEQPEVENNQAYDFNFQETVALTPELRIESGDEFKLTCTYNSMDKDEPTLGGESTRDEMCLAFVSYYPMVSKASFCGTMYNPEDREELWGVCGREDFPEVVEPIVFTPRPVVDPCEGFEPLPYNTIPRIGEVFDPSRYLHKMILDADEKIIMHWNFEHERNLIHFAIQAQTPGWVGFGISPNGDMVGADVYISWIDENGIPYFRDRYANARALPGIDESQDVFDIVGHAMTQEQMDNVGRRLPEQNDENVPEVTSNPIGVVFAIIGLLLVLGAIGALVYVRRRKTKAERNNSRLVELNTRGVYESA